MTRLKGFMAVTGAALGLALTGVGPVLAAPHFQPPYGERPYEQQGPRRLQDLIARTQTDLRDALAYATGDKQRDRTRDAERHLSDFDKRLTQGRWNHHDLHEAIESVQNVLDHNTLNAADRQNLRRDVEELKIARDRH
ncbi:MAG TPA: hypothetical protein VG168_13295 [Bryobacteraceae bacterium]|jgi:hypothetical protein|nr:hypothetical protein [Bryobacteraceae bacterium]